jgi:hypothetical protein
MHLQPFVTYRTSFSPTDVKYSVKKKSVGKHRHLSLDFPSGVVFSSPMRQAGHVQQKWVAMQQRIV